MSSSVTPCERAEAEKPPSIGNQQRKHHDQRHGIAGQPDSEGTEGPPADADAEREKGLKIGVGEGRGEMSAQDLLH